MNFTIVNDYETMSRQAAKIISERVRNFPELKLGLATGGTPEGTYQQLIEDYEKKRTSYQKITTFNLDEYIGLPGDHPNSYRYYMNTHLFNHIDIQRENTFVPRGDSADPMEECERYEKLIAAKGGVELQLLGIGRNGHIGFNEPGTSFSSKTHVVTLTETTRAANSRFFARIEHVPKQAITIGIGTIMKSKEILLLISGDRKKEAVKQLLFGEINEHFPASILRQHPNVTILVDKAAAGLVEDTLRTDKRRITG